MLTQLKKEQGCFRLLHLKQERQVVDGLQRSRVAGTAAGRDARALCFALAAPQANSSVASWRASELTA